ncbi:AT-rich interactive domain-containing protein 4-like [Durio zibethinus]|uniref:AT-rich interactive domain-containing protein 4-like n=1 Tax=Durio zibethinus TaxID=66656 RepID=A0A6P5XWQ7_DURZI|nr:AT-rich interactive domain-containing protein 4-like [Durio zibethinus]XP_022732625.1 AT-rich interactive domain-containing protein 4-like [Durio zibethinus]XP_022732626.1 AT-rich interactive domain-containing protein 4-like [Durio zibethinus]
MMFSAQGSSRNHCSLLAVLCGDKVSDNRPKQSDSDDKPRFPFPELASSGRIEVQLLNNPSVDEFRRVLESLEPNIVYLQGEQTADSEEIGSLVWGYVDLSTPEALCGLFGSTLPTTVYLETPNGDKLAEALHSKGVPYVIYWKNTFSFYAACHFRQALLSVIQSSCSHTWDAFQLAHASFRLYCLWNNNIASSNSQKQSVKPGPRLLGEPPKIDVSQPEVDMQEEEGSPENLPAIKIYDDDVTMRFLVCGSPCELDAFLLGSLEDGLNALLSIEIRGSKLHNRASAPPPPLQAGTFSRGVVTMRCDFSTCSSAHISFLVSGSAQTCFNDQLLENHIKNELIEKSQLVHAQSSSDEIKLPSSEPRRSASIACGASVFEVCMKVPTWASLVLRQLAPDASYRSLVMLGIASIQGLSVASFEKDDAERLLFFCTRQDKDPLWASSVIARSPSWLVPPAPSRKRSEPCKDTKPLNCTVMEGVNGNARPKPKFAAMRPIPHTHRHKILPFSGFSEAERYDGDQGKVNLPVVPVKQPAPVTHRKALSSSYQAQQIISLNPLPLKKHGCGRAPIQVCSEEEFLRDVMQFLILRGHTRLVPQGGLAEFPDAILNAKRLDLFNLYREVVSRGGFHVGNGINWKGQVFSKMRNHTMTNRMTGVGNTLKRHYETYLLEYELAHDDVDGECCLLCHSSAAGDWVNCGICGEWAHFGCDRRQGLGAFKDYAKTDGLEYVCPHCSISNFKKKPQKTMNGY